MATLNVEKDFLRAANEGILIPVLMYHDIYHKDGSTPPQTAGKKRYAVSSDTFWQQMELLYRNGFETVPLEMCVAAARGYMGGILPDKAIAITFDDGSASDYSIALPVLKHFGFSATFFITTGRIGTNNYLTNHQVDELVQNGMVVGSHTVTHRFLSALDDDELYFELFESKKMLELITNYPVSQVSLPGGRCNDFVLDVAVRAGYEIVCTSNLNGYETPSEVLAQSIGEMVPLRLSRLAITNDTDMEDFQRIVFLDEWEIARRQRKQAVLNTVKHALGDSAYNALWEQYWTVRSFLSRA